MKQSIGTLVLCCVLALSLLCCGCTPGQPAPSEGTQETGQMPQEVIDVQPDATIQPDATSQPEGTPQPEQEPEEPPAINTLVLRNSASFTGTTPTVNENNEDGTYHYEDLTEDGMTTVVNISLPNGKTAEESEEDYVARAVTESATGQEREFTVSKAEEYTEAFALPAYYFQCNRGSNEDSRVYTGVAVLSDGFTYLYYYNCPIDHYTLGGMEPVFEEMLQSLELVEVE